jgi:hypothetical protein
MPSPGTNRKKKETPAQFARRVTAEMKREKKELELQIAPAQQRIQALDNAVKAIEGKK